VRVLLANSLMYRAKRNFMKVNGNVNEETSVAITHARAKTTVHKYESAVYDALTDGPDLIKARLEESFSGDINGNGTVETLQATSKRDGLSHFTGIERIVGKVNEKNGTFLLQVTGTVKEKKMKCDWFVIPGSGTGQLTGLCGEGGFTATLGKGGDVYLDYWFE